MIEQVTGVKPQITDPAGAKYLIIPGAHNAGFRICVCVATDGSVGWSLV